MHHLDDHLDANNLFHNLSNLQKLDTISAAENKEKLKPENKQGLRYSRDLRCPRDYKEILNTLNTLQELA